MLHCNAVPPPSGFVITPAYLQPQRSAEDDREYRRNYAAAEYINALYALDSGWDGSDVLVGVVDDGVREIGELEGQISDLSQDFGVVIEDGVVSGRAGGASVGDSNSVHGTPVAAIIAAKNDGRGVQGLAPGASIVSLRVDGMVDGEEQLGFNMDDALRYAADNGVRIVNMSLTKEERKASLALQSAVTYLADRGGLVVNSNGNDGESDPGNLLDMTARNREGWLFVGALDPDGTGYTLAPYSNKCGAAMDRCVVSMGTNVTHNVDGELIRFSGTSSAAPQVSALAAMILSKWPQLTGVDAGNVILNTTRDLGESGADAIYGRGLIDAKAALSPINPSLSNGLVASSADSSMMVLGSAFGDGGFGPASFEQALGSVTVLDAYGRDFSGDISGMVVRPGGEQDSLRRRIEAQARAGSAGFATSGLSGTLGWSAFETGYAGPNGERLFQSRLTNADFAARLGGTTLTAGFNSNDNVMNDILGLAPSSDAMFAYSPAAQTNVGFSRFLGDALFGMALYSGEGIAGALARLSSKAGTCKLGLIEEKDAVFGTPAGTGALRFGDGARTVFAEIASGFGAGDWDFQGYASLGATRLKLAEDMLLTEATTVTSGRFGITATRAALGGRMSLGLAQPLVALSGKGSFTVGSGYDPASRSLTFEERSVDFSGRIQPQLTIGFEKTGRHSAFRLGAASDSKARDIRAIATFRLRLH